jgi:hypothetical protein
MPTPDAPKASALNTSVPLRAPPSINTGTRPFTAATTSATQSIVARRVSSLRPPWLETMTPSAPCALAACASSPVTASRHCSSLPCRFPSRYARVPLNFTVPSRFSCARAIASPNPPQRGSIRIAASTRRSRCRGVQNRLPDRSTAQGRAARLIRCALRRRSTYARCDSRDYRSAD